MKQLIQTILIGTLALALATRCTVTNTKQWIDRKEVVDRNRVLTNASNPKSPAQVGNGEV